MYGPHDISAELFVRNARLLFFSQSVAPANEISNAISSSFVWRGRGGLFVYVQRYQFGLRRRTIRFQVC